MNTANIIIALVVPFLSVLAAHQLVRIDAKRRAVMDVFLKVNLDTINFRTAFLARHPEAMRGVTDQEAFRRTRDVAELSTALGNNCFSLGLIFGKKADALGRKIRDLALKAEILLGDNKGVQPSYKASQDGLAKEIEAIHTDMKALWKKVRQHPCDDE